MRVGGGGARSPPFTISTITYKVEVYDSAERADTLPLFLLYPLCTLWPGHTRAQKGGGWMSVLMSTEKVESRRNVLNVGATEASCIDSVTYKIRTFDRQGRR